MEYGCDIYSSATDARLRTLDSVHHAGVRLAMGAFRTSPIPSLLVDADFWPLDLRRQSLMLRCWFRTHRLPDSVPCLPILRDSCSQAYNTFLSILMISPFLMMVPNPTQVLGFVWFSRLFIGVAAFLQWRPFLLRSCLP
ncbi:hypothetical protein E2C01_070301 [Portunus trituberculatus]|uniref:Uncharacterized protein n=1 Tax=Portunus trituberculatus TaxID=210409 RepID=A0A5B7HWX5_PORTR|nr:hypothetical protein [Portunus trituberculatus]